VYKPEIGEVLTRHLGRVAAPEELWERIENPQVSARVPTRHAKVRAPQIARVRALFVLATLLAFAVVVHKYSMTSRVSKAAQAPEALNAACQLCHAGG
jgi:hypothetical protein